MPDEVAALGWEDPDWLQAAEADLARTLQLPAGGVLLDFPARESMLSVDLPLLTRDGTVERLTDAGRSGELGLPRVAPELYLSARRLRIFTVEPRALPVIPSFG